jgi:predicted glycosyltransferase
VVPEAIPPERLDRYGARAQAAALPGLKEEYYLADFEPDAAVLDELGLRRVASRSRSCARRRRCRSTTASRTTSSPRCSPGLRGTQTVVLPRVAAAARPAAAASSVPERAIDAQSLVAFADLVVSAGGTMNREAVRARHAGVDHVRGPARERSTSASSPRAACAGSPAPRSSSWPSARPGAASASVATRRC